MGAWFDRLTDANALYRAFMTTRKESQWKCSVQTFGANYLAILCELQRSLRLGTYQQKPCYEFVLHERGKVRGIKSLHIRDRVVQKAMCDEVLTPAILPHLIYDNGASLKGKGISFTRERMQCQLERGLRKIGLKNLWGYKRDFTKYFDNISHDLILAYFSRYIDDPLFMALFERLVRSYRIDISDLPESKRIWLESHPIDLLTYKPSTGGRFFLDRSVGIGSPLSQIIGTAIPTPMDNQALQHPGVFSYNRYMDDSIALSDSKDALEDLLGKDREMARKLGLFISEKKTEIFPVRKGFTFLQIKYSFPKEDKILQRLSPAAITRERRRLKKFSRIVGKAMTYREVSNAYQSWRGNAVRFDSHRSVLNMDQLYTHLFIDN